MWDPSPQRDQEIMTLLGITVAVKSRKASSTFETYETIFRFSKIASAAL